MRTAGSGSRPSGAGFGLDPMVSSVQKTALGCFRTVRVFDTLFCTGFRGPVDPEDGRVVSNFIVQALKNLPITIYGEGQQTRSFCYVDDLVEGFLGLMESAVDVTGPVNLGNPDEFTIRELAEIVIEMTGSRSKLEYGALPIDDPRQRQPNISKAGALLGWTPKVVLRDGLSRTIRYFEECLRRQVA